MKRTRNLFQTAVVVAGLAALPLAAQTSSDPNQGSGRTGDPSYSDPNRGGTMAPQGTHDPMPRTGSDYAQDRDDGFNFGWLGLLGLAGLWGLRRHGHHTTVPDTDLRRDTDIRR